ncbi:MAG: sugar transferase [bacterium]|nr:sugar transferase [bacterium]
MFSLVAVVLLSPLLVAIAMLIKLDSRGPVFYKSKRIGKEGIPFFMYKFRSMFNNSSGSKITTSDDKRITKIGKILRRWKLDELPNLFNVLRGEMSLVGPRPEVPEYVEKFKERYNSILKVKPGVTGPSQIQYVNESSILTTQSLEEEYSNNMLPDKINLDLEYIKNQSFVHDIKILFKTLKLLMPGGDR